MTDLSVIFPILNESKNPYFWNSLDIFLKLPATEIIIVDGGSSDGTLERLSSSKIKYYSAAEDRASRINLGVSQANGETILLHHPRSIISIVGIYELLENPPSTWGGFKHSFDWDHPLLSFTSWYSNYGRRNFWKVLYLDHCIFFPKDIVKNIFPLPEVEIFEDTYLSYRLRKYMGRPILLKQTVITSAIRFRLRGPFRQAVVNQLLKLRFYLGACPSRLNKVYERKMALNSTS